MITFLYKKTVDYSMKKRSKFLLISLVVLSLITGYIAYGIFVVPSAAKLFRPNDVIVGAHRGASLNYIENTLPSFEYALKNDGYKFIEFDVQYSKDKKKIIFHDTHLRRVKLKFKNIEDLTYQEILDEAGFHIPLYEDVMKIVAGNKPLNIEVKSQGNLEYDKELSDFIINDINERGITDEVLFSSVSSDVIEYVKKEYPYMKTGKIYWVVTATFIDNEFFVEKMFSEIDRVNADYLLLFASNIKIYDAIREKIQERKASGDRKVNLAFWYLIGKMYLVHEDAIASKDNIEYQSLGNSGKKISPERQKEIGAWWIE